MNRLGRYREALADLDILIGRNPKDFMLYELRGTAHEALGEHEPARLDREKARSLLPRDPNRPEQSGLELGDRPPRAARPRASPGSWPGKPSRWHPISRCISTPWAWRCTAPVGTSKPSMSWSGASPRAEARPTPSTCSSWRWPTTTWVIRARPERASTGPCSGGTGNKKLTPQYIQELTTFRAEAEAVLAGPGGDLPADVFAPR